MSIERFNANHSAITPALARDAAFAARRMAPERSLRVKMHPEQAFMWGSLAVQVNVVSTKPDAEGSPFLAGSGMSMCAIPIEESIKVPVDIIRFESDGKLIVEVFNLTGPVDLSQHATKNS